MAKATTRTAPVTRTRPIVDTTNTPIGGSGVAHMPSTGAPRIIQEHDDAASQIDVQTHLSKDKADRMAFDCEPVTVIVQDSGDSKYPDPCISVWVNGKHQLFVRNMRITCKRMYVEALARSRPESYDNQEYTTPDGVRGYRYNRRVAPKYPFQVVQDDNPRGAAWLQTLLAAR